MMRKRLWVTGLVLVLLFVFSQQSGAWSDGGHQIIGQIAWKLLTPHERQVIGDLIRQNPTFDEYFNVPARLSPRDEATRVEWMFSQASVWPDLIRGTDRNRPSWHFINRPIFLTDQDRAALSGQISVNLRTDLPSNPEDKPLNAVQAIQLCLARLKDPAVQAPDKGVYICWLFHLVEDLHQPCHATALFSRVAFPNGDKGANSIRTDAGKMHGFWDGLLGKDLSHNDVRKSAAGLLNDATLVASGVTAQADLDPSVWVTESAELSDAFVYSTAVRKAVLDREEGRSQTVATVPLSASYKSQAGKHAQRRAIEAGYRLAELLKEVVAAQDSATPVRSGLKSLAGGTPPPAGTGRAAAAATPTVIAEGQSGLPLIQFLRQHYSPSSMGTYKAARRAIFANVDNHAGHVTCVYTGAAISTTEIPSDSVMNVEHTWPQSKFQKRLPMRADLHHLFPTLSRVNSVRGNHPFAEIPDIQTEEWWVTKTPQTAVPAAAVIDSFSESTSSVFEPREDHKGNVARAMFYFWTVYGDSGVTPHWIDSQVATLTAWHEDDPVDAAERDRNAKIKDLQGNHNPFVLDPTLVRRLDLPGSSATPAGVVPAVPLVARATVLTPGTEAGPVPVGSTKSSAISHRFPDFHAAYLPPTADYAGAYFRLSQDYPTTEPPIDSAVQKILDIPFDQNQRDANWERYLVAVRDYCFEGNLEVEWRGHENPVRKWYHVPWQHYGEKGREGIHGLTRETTAVPKQLAATQLCRFQTHAVALYNDRGGFTIGEVWKNQFEPNPLKATFPEGTVVVKVLFTQADEEQVPYLINPIVWEAYVQDINDLSKRKVQKLRLLQMDIMVKDQRAKATGGWVFGTYCYNGALARQNPWENLVPVGLQWGNDSDVMSPTDNPETRVPVPATQNAKLQQTIINPSSDLPPQHLGWGGRLNGPADNYRSSCMSCHSTAQYPGFQPQHPDFDKRGYLPGSKEWSAWFRNLPCGDSFSPTSPSDPQRAISTDFSLQLQIGINNLYLWKQSTMSGHFTPVLPDQPQPRTAAKNFEPTSEAPAVADP